MLRSAPSQCVKVQLSVWKETNMASVVDSLIEHDEMRLLVCGSDPMLEAIRLETRVHSDLSSSASVSPKSNQRAVGHVSWYQATSLNYV